MWLLPLLFACADLNTSADCEASTWFADQDGDGFGDAATPLLSCERPEHAVEEAGDCDDLNAEVHPGAAERCDGLDDDCDREVDEDLNARWFRDGDGDGWGDAAEVWESCAPPTGYVAEAGDCDDEDDAVAPEAPESCDGLDNNCDGLIDEGLLGRDMDCAAESCAEILSEGPAEDDDYWLLPNNADTPALYTCDMSDGGWTLLIDWDRETHGDTLDDLTGAFDRWESTMGETWESDNAVKWSDGDGGGDTLLASRELEIHNGGEVRATLKYIGDSMEKSGTWFFAEDAEGAEDIACGGLSEGYEESYSAQQLAMVPYDCDAIWQGGEELLEGTWVASFDQPALAFTLLSFHQDNNRNDVSKLYTLAVWVR